jgi:hypothetical protein
MANLNPASVEYTVGMSKKEIQKEEGKIEGVEKNQNKKENINNNILSKKRRQAINNETEVSTDVEVITSRIKKLNIEQQYQEADTNYFTEIRTEVGKEKVNENVPLELTESEQMELEDLISLPTPSSSSSSISSSASIEHSDWSPKYRTCTGNKSFKGNFPTYILLGETKEERIKYVRWILGENKHIRTIKEAFKKGNNWIEVDFDCEHSRDEAIKRINRKEGEWLKLIPEEEKNKNKEKDQFKQSNAKGKQPEHKSNKEKDEDENLFTKKELEETYANYLTIWDLPANINRTELEFICRKIKKANIVRIKRSKYKALAVIKTDKYEDKDIPWSLPIDDNKLVRVMKGDEDYEERNRQSQFTAKLTELPGSASEVLLLRCLKNKGAKSVYIPSNRNGNQRRTATITFATKEEMNSAQTKPIRYNNFRVYWVMDEKRETKKRESLKNRRNEDIDESGQDTDSEDYESVDSQESKKYKNRRRNRKDINTENQTQMQDLLQRILTRLERLEIQKVQSKTFTKRGWPQRF